jgi:hypothetical protein
MIQIKLNTPESMVIIVSFFYFLLACIPIPFASDPVPIAGWAGVFFLFWLIALYCSYRVIRMLIPMSLEWDSVIWIAILVIATFVIVWLALWGMLWTGVYNPMAPCGGNMKC